MLRIYHILRNSGIVYTRSECLDLLRNGKVIFNGKIISSPDYFVDLKGEVIVNGKKVSLIVPEKVYILLNKPVGYTCHRVSDNGRSSVIDLIKLPDSVKRTIFPVGRLDVFSFGLLILTNDGRFAAKLLHDGVEKEYECLVGGYLDDKSVSKIEKGVSIFLEGDRRKGSSDKLYVTKPCKIVITNRTSSDSKVLITLCEGRKRQIKKMFDKVGFPVLSLKRIRIGNYSLDGLKEGELRLFNLRDR